MIQGDVASWGPLRIGGQNYEIAGVDTVQAAGAGKPSRTYYNAPEHLVTPTYDGSGCTVHPDVIDMLTLHGIEKWRGYRYWMAHTPYYQNTTELENPSILVSNNGVKWVTPPGLTNPLYPGHSVQYNSDTDMVYDPATDQLVLFFRIGGSAGTHRTMRSSDGITWTGPDPLPGWTTPGENVSPAVVRMPDGTWAMWGLLVQGRTLQKWTAPAPTGPWTGPSVCTGFDPYAWHLDITRIGSKLYALVYIGGSTDPAPNGLYLASSADSGETWSWKDQPAIVLGTGWDCAQLYRSTLQPHERGDHMRVWYVGQAARGTAGTPESSWHIGTTMIPLTEWP